MSVGAPLPHGDITIIDLKQQFHSPWEFKVFSTVSVNFSIPLSTCHTVFCPLNMRCKLYTFIHHNPLPGFFFFYFSGKLEELRDQLTSRLPLPSSQASLAKFCLLLWSLFGHQHPCPQISDGLKGLAFKQIWYVFPKKKIKEQRKKKK